jgi:predicted amidohydrolase
MPFSPTVDPDGALLAQPDTDEEAELLAEIDAGDDAGEAA